VASTAYDTDALLASIRRRARLPVSSVNAPGWEDADLLFMANEELLTVLTPMLLRTREKFFVATKDTAMVSGTVSYALPTRGALNKTQDILRVGPDNVTNNLVKLEPEEMSGKDMTLQGTPTHYYFQGNRIFLWPVPNVTHTLRVPYFRRPSRLVGTSAVAVVSTINTGTKTITTTDTVPGTFSSSALYDLVQGYPPFDSLSDDVVATSTSGTSFVATATLPTDLLAGDYVALAGESPVLQLPVEFGPVLAQRVANAILRGGVDKELLAAGEKESARLEAEAFGGVEERNEGEADLLCNDCWP
jgi:hypothetical protein